MKALAKIPPRRKEEILGLLLLTCGILIFLSLVSHSTEDDFNLTGELGFSLFEIIPNNWIGLVGAGLSYLLYYLVGFLAFFIPVYAVISGVGYLFRWKLPQLRKKVWYTFLILSALMIILSIQFVQHGGHIDFVTTPGGAISIGLASFVLRLFGTVGTALIFGALMVFFFFMLIEWRPSWWDKKVAAIPANVRRTISGWFGASKKTKTKTRAKTKSKTPSKPFSFKRLLEPFKSAYNSMASVFTRTKQVENEIEEEDIEEPDQNKFTDLFEKISDDRSIRAEVKSSEETDPDTEKLLVKMTRKAEDGFSMPDYEILDENPQPDQAISNAEMNQVADQLRETLETFNIKIVDNTIEKYPGGIQTVNLLSFNLLCFSLYLLI